jgi:hypothetical protein
MTSRQKSQGIVQASEARSIAVARGADRLMTQTVDERPQAMGRLGRCPAPAPHAVTNLSRHSPYGIESFVLVGT